LVVALVLAAVCALTGAAAETLTPLLRALELRSYPPRTAAPAFSGASLDARRLALADLRGRVVVVNFWASWCRECRPEMPALEGLHRRFGAQGLAVVGINAGETRDTVRRYAADLGLSFPLVLDPSGSINATYGVIGLPTTFLVARDGRAVAFAVGARDWSGAPGIAILKTLLAEPVPANRPAP
jgi:peroxiredoxin